MDLDKAKIAQVLKQFREKNGWTKTYLCRWLGISNSHYGNLEAGRNIPSMKVAAELRLLGLDLFKMFKSLANSGK